jgi:hypothetical protein
MAVMAHIYRLHVLIASLAGLINRRQAEVLEYLIEESRALEENRALKEQFKGRRLRLTDDQRRRVAPKADPPLPAPWNSYLPRRIPGSRGARSPSPEARPGSSNSRRTHGNGARTLGSNRPGLARSIHEQPLPVRRPGQ